MLGSAGLLFLAATLTIGAVSVVVYLVLAAEESPFNRFLGRYEARLEEHTRFLLVSYSGAQIARLQVLLCAILVAMTLVFQSISMAAIAVLALMLPPYVLWKKRMVRVAKLEEQLDTWLLMLSNALKATPSIGEAIGSTVTLVQPPFSEEVDLLVKEMQLGTPVDRGVNNVARRIQSTVISGALATIVVARQTGGDLPEILERSAAALREAARLEGVLRTKTAEGRGQVVVLAAIPFVLTAIIGFVDPQWFNPMLAERVGRAMLLGCLLMWGAALFWAYKIVDVDL